MLTPPLTAPDASGGRGIESNSPLGVSDPGFEGIGATSSTLAVKGWNQLPEPYIEVKEDFGLDCLFLGESDARPTAGNE